MPQPYFTDTYAEAQALQRLVDLGYIERLSPDTEAQINMVARDRKYNLSVVYASSGRTDQAIELLEELYQDDPLDLRYNHDLIHYYSGKKNTTRAREIFDHYKKNDSSLFADFDYLEAKLMVAENRKEEALILFGRALEKAPHFVNLMLDTAETWYHLRNYDKAMVQFQQVLLTDKENTDALVGMAAVKNQQQKYEEGMDHALEALHLNPMDPFAHYQMGVSLYQLEEYEGAANAFETCLLLQPAMSKARNMLINIYRDYIVCEEKYASHLNIFLETRKQEVIIVSGLPRSGTSMMMQILREGGITVLADGAVLPDDSNPKGYFEFEPVKNSKHDLSWLEKAQGKAVKVISPLLPYLKLEYKLKVILMERNLDEVIISQQLMLAAKKKKTVSFDLALKNIFLKHMSKAKAWVESNNHVEYICLNYNEVLQNPSEACAAVNQFLGGYLDEKKMAGVIDRQLYRVKC